MKFSQILHGKWNHLTLVAAAAGITALLMSRSAQSADPPAAAPLNIAIANPQKIEESVHEYQDIIGQLELDRKSFTSAVNDKKAAIAAMQQSLTYLKSDSAQYAEQQDKLLKTEIEYKAWTDETQLFFQNNEKTKMKNLFLEVQDAVAQIAQKEGINLVIAEQLPKIPDNLDNVELTVLSQILAQRSILYSDQSRDISGEVITLMDKNYASRSAPAPAPTPSPSPAPSDTAAPAPVFPPTN